MVQNQNEPAGYNLPQTARELNRYVKEFYECTVIISNLLSNEDEDSIFKIKEFLDRRDLLINNYDKTMEQYSRELNELGDSQTANNSGLFQQLKALEQERQKNFGSITDIEVQNQKKIAELYSANKDQVKRIKEGKKIINAYQGAHPMADGVFFDKRR